ncbi:hypothetical protein [uncultured Polaribacter sp.]|uniref:hypothetical protein n=1 Tax=uncultured Polaribacter sp. TaxID=174711 RepID=UPI0026240FC9|nr:hypothetical protein [uncultured Polaribacter sp.]
MTFSEKIKQPIFWSNFIKIALPFFIILIVMTLLWRSWSDIFAGNFHAISESHFKNGKWIAFFASKTIASIIYGLYVTNKNMK